MDALNDILGSMRLTGAVFLEGHAHGDWCVFSQIRPEDVADRFAGGGPLIGYHFIHAGKVYAQVDGHDPVEAKAGSILMFPANSKHRLFTKAIDNPVDAQQFLTLGEDGGLARFEVGEGEETAEFFCGFLGVVNGHHPLLDALPPLLKVDDIESSQSEWLHGNLRFLTIGRKSPETMARIAELLFAHAVRIYVDELPPEEGGWLRGLSDNAVSQALNIIHHRYAEDLDVEMLAREAGVSRSVLGERFVELLGEPPMRYCARWRMRMAANMLRDGKENSAVIAYAVGFNSEAAFNRSFKREYGEPPATWRRKLEQLAPAKAEQVSA